MPKLIFTQEEVNDYLKEKKEVKGIYHDSAIFKADDIKIHADGIFPVRLIRQRRPNEPLEVFIYRELIYKPKTKSTFSKVYSSLQKIRRANDWSIKYEDSQSFSKISDDETLESYCEYNFPYFTSLTNWTFSLLLRKYLIDSNAVVFVMPLNLTVQANEYLQPFPEIYESQYVLMFVPDDYAVLKIPAGCVYYVRNKPVRGTSFYFITTEYIVRYDQIDSRGNHAVTVNYTHGIGCLPVVKLGGIIIDQFGGQSLYESRIAAMLPELDEALREYSDLQASVVIHLYPERWEFTQNECKSCKGTGRRHNPLWINGQDNFGILSDISCDAAGCQNGYIVSGPYSKIMIRPQSALEGGGTMPSPPAGYIQKDVEIIKLQDQRVAQHEYDALAAINFQFLANTPLNQSGTAKEVDKDELNNTVHSIAEDIVKVLDNIYYFIAKYRYKELYSLDDIDAMLPVITVPQKFDLLGVDSTQKEILALKNASINPYILNAIEIDFATKRFSSQAEIRDMVQLMLELDPLSNIKEDEKMTRLSNKGITQETYVVSSNIMEFVQRGIEEDAKFVELSKTEQKAKILEYAQEMIASQAVVSGIDMNAGLDNIYGQPINSSAPVLKVGSTVRVVPGHEKMQQHVNVDMNITKIIGNTATAALPDGSLSSDYNLTHLIPYGQPVQSYPIGY